MAINRVHNIHGLNAPVIGIINQLAQVASDHLSFTTQHIHSSSLLLLACSGSACLLALRLFQMKELAQVLNSSCQATTFVGAEKIR
jgi:hypothetical protein